MKHKYLYYINWFVLSIVVEILYLRKNKLEPRSGFRVPFVPYIPILAFLFCGYLDLQMPAISWISFGVWHVIGLIVYIGYGHKHLTLNTSVEPMKKVGLIIVLNKNGKNRIIK
ncbi:amino acid permease C-terminal domain-containing protein [Neobacillus sp. WH10]|uniref:amino acid permease C-terminal domain-containing protein n=1 Tax=Neobacillus sp. WH10 TaxID=3047873 RepID=UPI0024C1431A|nr:amino acid permease C-terminal domain-containing protein [Neobacillus sp. WH10]WHY78682.1 amino acid permease C-terminal domain-containing protein [Neobacillus sp. WH10]